MATESYKARIKAINLLLPEVELWHLSRSELAQKWRNEVIQYEQRLRSGKFGRAKKLSIKEATERFREITKESQSEKARRRRKQGDPSSSGGEPIRKDHDDSSQGNVQAR